MIEIKSNFKINISDQTCRLGQLKEETQDHIFIECTIVKQAIQKTITKHDIFEDNDIESLQETVITSLGTFNSSIPLNSNKGPGDPGTCTL